MDDKPLFRRRTYLLYRFQTRYAFAVVLVTAFVAAVMSLVSFRLFGGTGIAGADLLGLSSEPKLKWLVGWIFVLILSSFGLLYLLVVLASHRVAGPLAVITKHLSEFARGKYPQMRELRKDDELKELFGLFKTAVEHFKTRDLDEIKILQVELQKLEGLKLGASSELKSSLQFLLDRRLLAVGVEDSLPERDEAAEGSQSQTG